MLYTKYVSNKSKILLPNSRIFVDASLCHDLVYIILGDKVVSCRCVLLAHYADLKSVINWFTYNMRLSGTIRSNILPSGIKIQRQIAKSSPHWRVYLFDLTNCVCDLFGITQI